MRKLGLELLLRSAFTVTVLLGTAEGRLVTVGPADPWCLTINSASPGDEIVLLAGSYTTPCSAVNEHLVGGGNSRPPRLTPPAAPSGLRAQ